jgi:hypothetical protein
MTKAQHTPGPWTQGSNYEVVAMDGTNICKVHNDEGQGAANARLLSKAPAMLDALLQYRDDMKWPPKPDSCERRVEMIDAILARIWGAK